MHSVRVGLRLDPILEAPEDDSAERLARLADLAEGAESRGIDVLWVAERHGAEVGPRDPAAREASAAGLIPSAMIFCAGVAVRTRRLRIATGLLPLPLYHPLRVAEDGASLDGLSGGRFELGVGLGGDAGALTRFGVGSDERAARFDEALDVLRLAWQGGPVEFHGRYFQIDGPSVHPRPVQPGGPPLWIGASAPAGQARAAERGAGLVIPMQVDPTPFLDRYAECGHEAPPRLALLADDAARAELPEALAARRDRAEIALDWMLPLDEARLADHGASLLDGWAERIERLRALANA